MSPERDQGLKQLKVGGSGAWALVLRRVAADGEARGGSSGRVSKHDVVPVCRQRGSTCRAVKRARGAKRGDDGVYGEVLGVVDEQ